MILDKIQYFHKPTTMMNPIESIHIHISYPPAESSIDLLRSLLVKRFDVSTGEEIVHPESVHYLVSGRPTQDEIKRCSNLKAVIIPFAGIPSEMRAVMRAFPHVGVHNLHHNAIVVVEMTLALLLAACKHIISPHEALRHNDWRPRYAPNPAMLLQGKTALLLGYGEIGSRLAKVLYALDMHILAIRKSISSLDRDRFAMVYPTQSLHRVLPRANVLINTLPLTPQTKSMIGEKELFLLPRGAVVVNVGRGEVIDQYAFFQALKNNHLGAAAIDVWYNYPEDEPSRAHTTPAEFPFTELENVVLSPHRAGGLHSQDTERLRMEHLAALLNHAAHGEPLPNRVELSRGY